MGAAVKIQKDIVERLLVRARETPMQECCGLLAGNEGVISTLLAATNAAIASATSYEIAPEETFTLMREMRSAGLDLLGIFHSHPKGVNQPSATDIELAYYPDTPYFILSPQADVAKPVRAFEIREGKVTELKIEILA